MTDILKKIIAVKRHEIEEAKKVLPAKELEVQARNRRLKDRRNFQRALVDRVQRKIPAVIAEVKKASPSKGLIRPNFKPAEIARSYEKAGAACLSVLTDKEFFQGCSEFLMEARQACSLPVLRKDFIVDEYQVLQAGAWGADAILLIAAELELEQMQQLAKVARELSMDVLVESHNPDEIAKALQIPNALIGINNRNLRDFSVNLETTVGLQKLVQPGVPVITESGIRTKEDVQYMLDHGIYCFLVGEAFMRESNPGQALTDLFGCLNLKE